MEQPACEFDKALIDDAVHRIQQAAEYVARLGRRLPRDPVRLSILRQQVEELRVGLIVMTAVADGLQKAHDTQAAGMKELAWAVRSAGRTRPR